MYIVTKGFSDSVPRLVFKTRSAAVEAEEENLRKEKTGVLLGLAPRPATYWKGNSDV